MAKVDLEAALEHLGRVDSRMKDLIERAGPPAFRPTRSTFQSLCRAIVYQQLSGKAAGTIYRRFRALFPSRPGGFPSPGEVAALPLERLYEAGLSRQKASYLKDLAHKMADGTLRPRRFGRLSDEEISQELTQVKGIGQWTADMFLIFTLRRLDVLPLGDLGVQKGLRVLYKLDALPSRDQMLRLAEPWRPYRSVASWYLWRVLEMELPG